MEALTGTPAAGRERRLPTAAGALIIAGACLLAAACSGGSSSSSSPGYSAGAANRAAAVPGAGRSAAVGTGSRLTTLVPSGHAIVYTAHLTVRARSTGQAAQQAAQIAASANGYVSSEAATTAHGAAGGSVSITLKVPPAAYTATLAALSHLGKQLSAAQATQDVTQTVADVSSRVASAKAAISQLRTLLAHAGSVGGLLDVQEQINQQEAALEALESQQRALDHSVAYATISLLLVSTPAAARHHARHAGGFTGGLLAGWHALLVVMAGLAAAAGAVLPFAVPLAAIAVGGWLAWRRYGRRRLTAGREPTPGAPGP
jgi:Domain of unknown function (DUF4349)